MKQIIRLTESDLHKIVKESVQNILEGRYNYKSNLNKHKALAHIFAKKQGVDPSDFFAREQAIDDINKDFSFKRVSKKQPDLNIGDYHNCYGLKDSYSDIKRKIQDNDDYLNSDYYYNTSPYKKVYDNPLTDPNVMTFDDMDYDMDDVY